MPLRFASWLVAAVLLVCAGCQETPVQGFEAFYAALADGSDAAFERLSARGRAELAAAARAQGKDPAHAFAGSLPKSTVRSIAVVDEISDASGERATLEVTDVLGAKERVHMVREEGRWRVDLSP